MGKVLAICISEKKGTLKNEINEAKFIEDFGIENDAHAGKWHRQVSLLEFNKIDEFRKKVRETHGESKYAKEYLMIADLMEMHFDRSEGE